jgi:ATP-dependent helicase/DNAse subunit B
MSFEYTHPETPEGYTRLSPSNLSNFFSYPSIWFKETVLGEKDFIGNTSSELGSIVHQVAERVAKNLPITKEEVEAYIDSINIEGVDKDVIRANWYDMSYTLINEYVLHNKPNVVEHQVSKDLGDNVMLSGTLDGYYNSGIVLDYKTEGKKPNIDSIPFNYKLQMMAYSDMLLSSGRDVNQLRIVYVVRATKTLPVRLFKVDHIITEDDWKEYEDTMTLIRETLVLQREHPEYTHLLFKSMKLKELGV